MNAKVYYQVAKQSKTNREAQAELFVVEDEELQHFLHEQLSQDSVLIFSEMPARNIYTLANDID